MTAIPAFAVYAAAALAEIAGCFAVWAWMRPGASALWLLPCIVSLAAFAWALTLAPSAFAGRASAAYGGVHIEASLVRPWAIGSQRPESLAHNRPDICPSHPGLITLWPHTRYPVQRGNT